jgi:hypothetical protein
MGNHAGNPSSNDWRIARCGDLRAGLEQLHEAVQMDIFDPRLFSDVLARFDVMLQRRLACAVEMYEEAMGRAPWIAPKIRELKDQQQRLMMSLMHFGSLHFGDIATLRRHAADFALQALEYDASEASLHQAAFPHPRWVEDASEPAG